MTSKHVVLAVSGASGAIYAVRLLDVLVAAGREVHLSISPAAVLVLEQELGVTVSLDKFSLESLIPSPARAFGFELTSLRTLAKGGPSAGAVRYEHFENLMAPIASGSFLTAGMVICPCSGSTLGGVVHGSGDNLIHRAAGVHLKERRKLIVVPRETPLSTIQLDNMKRAADAGAVVLPAMPGFYHGVQSIRDLIDFVVARICDQLAIDNTLIQRWGT